jgi:hypothetical protein
MALTGCGEHRFDDDDSHFGGLEITAQTSMIVTTVM